MSNSNYGYSKKMATTFEKAIERTKGKLEEEGFGILTEIDIKATLKKKIDINMDNYTILGACHPASAHQSIQSEIEIGLMLPCNVIVYQKDGEVVVSAIKPSVAMGMIENEELDAVASDIELRLKTVIDNL
ncbi:DUF302 domain-containing protein [Flavobacterium sp. SM2513]|uniref:DUF302 domain-containing protein n=1 Tax=Flavobacterium sp. SM2513 TaxID=3424766 RepID=UPI003D7FF532